MGWFAGSKPIVLAVDLIDSPASVHGAVEHRVVKASRTTSLIPLSESDVSYLHAVLNGIAPIGRHATKLLAIDMHVMTSASGTFLLRGGERARNLFVLTHGLVREFHVDDRGVEHTRSFVSAGGVTGSLFDLLETTPSVTWIEVLEETRALVCPYAQFVSLCDQELELARLSRRSTERLYQRKARREYSLLAMSGEERLVQWQQEHPGLDERISRQLLASYLGITPVHLSRLLRLRGAKRAPVRRDSRGG